MTITDAQREAALGAMARAHKVMLGMIELTVVGFSDRAIIDLDLADEDQRLSKICDDMRANMEACVADAFAAPVASGTSAAGSGRG